MKKIRWKGNVMAKISIDKEIKDRLVSLRNKMGFIDINHVVKFLLDIKDLAKKEDVENIINKAFGIEKEVKVNSKVDDGKIPIIVPEPNVEEEIEEPVIKEVTCPQCTHKFSANIRNPIKCPICGLEGKSDV